MGVGEEKVKTELWRPSKRPTTEEKSTRKRTPEAGVHAAMASYLCADARPQRASGLDDRI